jgi:hypothetical protein
VAREMRQKFFFVRSSSSLYCLESMGARFVAGSVREDDIYLNQVENKEGG